MTTTKTIRKFYVIQHDECVACQGAGEIYLESGECDDCPACGGTGGVKKETPLETALKAIVFKDIMKAGAL